MIFSQYQRRILFYNSPTIETPNQCQQQPYTFIFYNNPLFYAKLAHFVYQ